MTALGAPENPAARSRADRSGCVGLLRGEGLDGLPGWEHAWPMVFVSVLAWIALVVGVAGFVVGLRRSRRIDEMERGLVLWMVLAWAGLVWLVGTELA